MKTDASVQSRGARVFQALDLAHGITELSASGVCPRGCGALAFDTDELGRSLDRCWSCGYVRLTSTPGVRPEGEDYQRVAGHSRPPKPRVPVPSTDPAVLLLRETRAARTAAGPSAALLDAKRMYDANLEAIRQARKGGRPRKIVAADRVHRGPVVILDDEPPAVPPPPPASLPAAPPSHLPPPEPLMPTDAPPTPRTAKKCGHPCGSKGPIPDLCGDCRIPSAAASTKKEEKRRPRVETGYRPPRPSKNGGGYSDAIEQLETKIADLDAERKRLVETRDHLRTLEAESE